jgi:plasmid stabilization system protein ParE
VSRFVVSLDARADLDCIWDYVAERSSAETAAGFIWKFYETFSSLASSPAAGIATPDLPPGGGRKFPMGNYLSYYRPMRGKVIISRMLHGKRVQKRALREKPPRWR